MTQALELYQQHFIDKQDERLGLFLLMKERYDIQCALYPGSFTHLTPAFVFSTTCFVDTDRRAKRFFGDASVLEFVKRRKIYAGEPVVRFHHADYSHGFAEAEQDYDLLISQYAGFVSQACKRYLNIGGYLLVNNSHGDASMASIDEDYKLRTGINRRGERFSLSESDLEDYFVPKKEVAITRATLEQTRRGVGYKKTAFSYVFQRVT